MDFILASRAVLGIVALLFVAWLLGGCRPAVRRRRVVAGVGLQISLAFLFLSVPPLRFVLRLMNEGVVLLDRAVTGATGFMFGYLGGATVPFQTTGEGSTYIVAFRVLPLIMVVSALSAVLFYWGVLPRIVHAFSWLLTRTLDLRGPLSFSAASSLFLGIIEAPLLVKPYLQSMSRGELLALMTCVMSTVAGTVMVLYASVLNPVLPEALGHVLVASVVSVPAALTVAHLIAPEPLTEDEAVEPVVPTEATSAMDALMRGTKEGLDMVLQVVAAIIVLFSLVYLANELLALLPLADPLTLEKVLGAGLAPVMWLLGIPWAESRVAGELMGTKTVLNEFVAYVQLAAAGESLSTKTRLVLTYAMCGFANFGSLGILVGGLDALLPGRRKELGAIAATALAAGTLSTLLTGCVVSVLLNTGLVPL